MGYKHCTQIEIYTQKVRKNLKTKNNISVLYNLWRSCWWYWPCICCRTVVVCPQFPYREIDMIFRIFTYSGSRVVHVTLTNQQTFRFAFQLWSLPQLAFSWWLPFFLLLHRAEEIQPGRNSYSWLQFLANTKIWFKATDLLVFLAKS